MQQTATDEDFDAFTTATAEKPPLPVSLLSFLPQTPEQKSLTDYPEVHTWWWLVYDEVLADMKQRIPDFWEEIDHWVHR